MSWKNLQPLPVVPGARIWTTTQVAKALDITYRKVDYWLRSGFVPNVPVDKSAVGTGYRRELTLGDVVQVAVIAELSDLTIDPGSLNPTQRKVLCKLGRLRTRHTIVTIDIDNLRDLVADRLESLDARP